MYMPPPQSIPLQRARGEVRVGVAERRGASRLADLYQAGCLKAMLPRTHGPAPEVVLINTAGGLTGGDRLRATVTAEAGARVTVATQTAERAYRSAAGVAEVTVSLRAEEGASLAWLAQETILFEGAALTRRLEVEMAQEAEVLLIEPLVFGRRAMGEVCRSARFKDCWQVRRGGRLLHMEATALGPVNASLRCHAGLNDAAAMATVLFLTPRAEDRLNALRCLAVPPSLQAASSAWEGKLVIRILAREPGAMRQYLMDIMTLLRGTPPPRVWTM